MATTSIMSTTMMGTTPKNVATASGYIALLQESDLTLRHHALKKLLDCVDTLWHEVAECLPDLEAIAEDVDNAPLEMRQIAAAVASRVFFHLDEPSQALRLALEAGETHWLGAADKSEQMQSPYVQRLVTAALDAYIQERKKLLADEGDDIIELKPKKQQPKDEGKTADEQAADSGLPMDQLQNMVYRLLETSCNNGQYRHALGIALEARETMKMKDILMSSGPDTSLLKYALTSVTQVVSSKTFRQEALVILAECLEFQFTSSSSSSSSPTTTLTAAACDLILVYQLLHQPTSVSKVLTTLFQKGTPDDDSAPLLGLQLCFDLMDHGDQAFCRTVADGLAPAPEAAEGGEDSKTEVKKEASGADEWYERAKRVLVGGFVSELALSFLHKQSQADRLIMENLKKSLEERGSGGRSSVLHNAAVMTHSYLYAGTTNDSFLRDYLDWMKKASNWAKFSATASLGVVHASHVTEAMHLLQPYLPSDPSGEGENSGSAVSPAGGYAEGGSLYALGLIHGSSSGSNAEKRKETTDFLRKHLRASHANEVISHGAALGVGLTAMGSADLAIVNELKEVLDTDSAVAGEAAGMAIGMVLVGTGATNDIHNNLSMTGTTDNREEIMEVVNELKNYARETQHEKIIRGIAIGLALMNYGQEENADALIEEMRSDRDPVLRYGAQYTIAMAYVGTGSNKAIRILLHTAVSDVSDDVRMAAVIGLAFVLYKTPHRVPQLVKLLLESFNPHVRYASCIAVGIAMSGTGDSESVALLEPMLDDMTDYVRQGALMGTAMIYMQQSDMCNNRKIRTYREKLSNIISEKHQSTLTKMGAILSTGIIDAGGRNCSLQLGSTSGFTKMTSAIGMLLWLQHWHWYPMMHMFSLALTPSLTIGLNKDFQYPKKFEVQCNAKPSQFAYPKKLEEKKEEKKKRVETVTLSTTAKEKARLARKRAKGLSTGGANDSSGVIAMETDEKEKKESDTEKKEGEDKDTSTTDKDAMEVDKKVTIDDKISSDGDNKDASTTNGKKPRRKREPEPTSFRIPNPARITQAQSLVCEFDLSQRYRPIRLSSDSKPCTTGVIVLTDSTPKEEDDELGAIKAPSLEPEGECAPPEPFEWTPPAPAPAPAAAATSAEQPTAMDTTTTEESKDSKDSGGDDKKDESESKKE